MPLLGIDFWTKRLGLAAETAGVAIPIGAVWKTDAVDEIVKIVTERRITGIVIGLPNHADGSVSKETRQMRSFVGELKKRLAAIPILEEDERYSSADAYFSLEQTGIRRKDAGRIDDMAAAIILQNHLDRTRR